MVGLSGGLFNNAARSEWIRLRTLIVLRWMAITGQTVAVLVAYSVLDIQFSFRICLVVIGTSAIFNLVATFTSPENKRLSERAAMLTLIFDLCQLVLLLYLTGGLHNPFSLLILAPVTISATALTLTSTLVLGTSALLSISILSFLYQPLELSNGEPLLLPSIFLLGSWAALSIGILFLAAYARRVTVESFSMSQALAATQMALEREHKLTALGGVVAAAAHELGTPLATIKLVSSELSEELSGQDILREDAELIHSQAVRCHEILRDMGRSGKDDLHLKQAPLISIVEEAAEPHAARGVQILFSVNGKPLDKISMGMPQIARHPEIIHGLRNLVQNAVDFAKSTVWINVSWSSDSIRVFVGDNGNGYPTDLLGRIGDPFLSRRVSSKTPAEERPEYEGMGLGLFIAKTLLERSGAEMTFSNAEARSSLAKGSILDPTGAIVTVRWPRERLEVTPNIGMGLGENTRFEPKI